VRDVLRIVAEKKHVSIVVTIGDNLQTVLTDCGRLKQVVYNYLSNAIKFTPENSRIEIRALWECGRVFRIEVEDTGPGIRESDVRRLFADFLQLDGTRPNQGTGLGLALTKRIVEGQGGIVGVRSTPGKGSVFFAILPIEFPPARVPETIPEHRQSSELDRTTAAIFANIRSLPDLALVP
jgi:signal transduction histidine kinase